TIGVHGEGSARGIRVTRDDDAAFHRGVKVRQHMALCERGEKQLLGVPPVGITVECLIGRASDLGFALGRDSELSTVAAIVARSCAPVARPEDLDGVFMLTRHNASMP